MEKIKPIHSKVINTTLLAGLLTLLPGCMTYNVIQHGRGHPENAELGIYHQTNPEAKPEPAWYLLVPLTVPADAATSPFQAYYFVAIWCFSRLGDQ